MATQFYLGNLTPNVQSEVIREYFELKGFKPRDFEVKVFRRKEGSRTVGAKLTVFKRVDIHEMVDRIGTMLLPWDESAYTPKFSRDQQHEEQEEEFKSFFIGNLTKAVRKETLISFLVARGFHPNDFDVTLYSGAGRSGAKVHFFQERFTLKKIFERFGSEEPEIEEGSRANVQNWRTEPKDMIPTSKVSSDAVPSLAATAPTSPLLERGRSRSRSELKDSVPDMKAADAFLEETIAQTEPMDTDSEILEVSASQDSPEPGNENQPHGVSHQHLFQPSQQLITSADEQQQVLPLISSLTKIVQQQSEIIKQQVETMNFLSRQH